MAEMKRAPVFVAIGVLITCFCHVIWPRTATVAALGWSSREYSKLRTRWPSAATEDARRAYRTVAELLPHMRDEILRQRSLAPDDDATRTLFKDIVMNDLPGSTVAFGPPSWGSLRFWVPGGESLVADGNTAQTRLASMIYAAQCRETVTDKRALVVDVGGLLGDFAAMAASAGCIALCFEPQPPFAALIARSLRDNGLSDFAVVINAAIGPVSGARLKYTRGDHGGAASFVPVDASVGTSAVAGDNIVPSVRLDHVVPADADILLLKIDVEGFDPAVLRSAEALIVAGRVRHAVFEYTPWWEDRNSATGRGGWQSILTWLLAAERPPRLFALHRRSSECYGPLDESQLDEFHEVHVQRHLQTDLFVTWDATFTPLCSEMWTAGVLA